MACGLEGRISEIILGDGNGSNDGAVVSIRVVSRGRHKFEDIRIIDDYICKRCDNERKGQRRCKQCKCCESCCRQTLHSCVERTHNWFWDPALLTLLRRADGSLLGVADEDDDDDATSSDGNGGLKCRPSHEDIATRGGMRSEEVKKVMSYLCSIHSTHQLFVLEHKQVLFVLRISEQNQRCARAHTIYLCSIHLCSILSTHQLYHLCVLEGARQWRTHQPAM